MAVTFDIKAEGVPLGETSGLEPQALEALRALGFSTAEALFEALNGEPQAFTSLPLGSLPELKARLSSLNGFKSMTSQKRESLLSLECALGLELRPSSLTDPGNLDTVASLPTDKFPITSNIPGIDLGAGMPPIRDQGQRGTCVAHATLRCYEYLEKKSTGAQAIDLSEQFVYWQCKAIDGIPNEEGTYVKTGVQVIVEKGACEETSCPYQKSPYVGDPSQRGPKPPSSAAQEALLHRAMRINQANPRDKDALKKVLANSVPVAFAMPVYASWYNSTNVRDTGRLTLPTPTDRLEGGHAVLLTGFGISDEFVGGGYFIFDNSWSGNWAPKNPFGAGRGILPFKYVELFGQEACWVELT